MTTDKMKENAQKITYLIMQYPEHNLAQIISLVQAPAIDINSAIWAAQDLGYISEPNDENGMVKLLSPPEPFNLGSTIDELENMLVYCFDKMTTKEQDLEENYLSSWTAGYSSQDVMIAVKRLISGHKLVQYNIVDGENEYTFFTAYGNEVNEWGRKQFKKPPKKAK